MTLEKRQLAKRRGTADPSCFRPIGDLRVLRRLLRRGRRRARPWHGAAVPPRPLPPPCRLQGHEAAARDTGSRLPFEPRMQPIGPSQPADDLVADLACSRTALSQESFWQIGFDDTVTNSMVEMSHQGLTKAFARGCRPFKPLTAPQRPGGTLAQGCPVSQMQTDRRRVRLCGTYVRYRPKLAVSTVLHGLVGPRGVGEQGRARQL